jgi:hypothetical protein
MNIKLTMLLLSGLTAAGYVSTRAQTPVDTGLRLGIAPAQLPLQELAFIIEKTKQKNSWGILLSGRLGTKEMLISNIKFNDVQYAAARYNSFTIGVDRKYFFKNKRHPKERDFLDFQALYRYWWYNNQSYYNDWHGSSPDDEYLSSGREHVFAVKILWGARFTNHSVKTGTYVDYFFGIGGRVCSRKEYGQQRQYYGSYSPWKDFSKNKTELLPTVHCGITLGLVFHKKAGPGQ